MVIFSSIKELQNKIIAYIDFYNQELVKPMKWKFKGFSKNKIIVNKL